jgi:peptidyl-prolyl cis-trans isomerase C
MWRIWPLWLLLAAASCDGCDESALDASHLDGGPIPGGLTAEQAKQVVARVGERTITLGDFAAALERMNQFDRLRYQTPQRRRDLLQELIDVELLAEEARRRGLHQKPEVEEAIRQILQEPYLAHARRELPTPAEIPMAEVKAYYEANKEKLTEPERRRVAAIVMDDRAAAEEVLAQARKADGEGWGKLFHTHSLTRPKVRSPRSPADLAGDLGIVGTPGDPKNESTRVPPAVQKAIFELEKVGEVHGELIAAEGKLYIVRLSGRSPAHTRTFEEAERTIRVELLKERQKALEDKLAADLRKRYPVEIDEAALKGIEIPKEALDYEPSWEGGAKGTR